MNDPVAFLHALRFLGAGLAMIGAIGAGAGIGIVSGGAVQAMGRNPVAVRRLGPFSVPCRPPSCMYI